MKRSEVLQEVLLALVGFTGEIVVSSVETRELEEPSAPELLFQPCDFSVRPGYHGLSQAEREQINDIVPLGRYHLVFQGYCSFYSLEWDRDVRRQSLYRLALTNGLQELTEEYLEDVARLETLVLSEETLTVSNLCQHLYKVQCICLLFIYSLYSLFIYSFVYLFVCLLFVYLFIFIYLL